MRWSHPVYVVQGVQGTSAETGCSHSLRVWVVWRVLRSYIPVRMTHASIPLADREGLGIENIDLVEDLRGALDGLEDENSGLMTPSDVSE